MHVNSDVIVVDQGCEDANSAKIVGNRVIPDHLVGTCCLLHDLAVGVLIEKTPLSNQIVRFCLNVVFDVLSVGDHCYFGVVSSSKVIIEVSPDEIVWNGVSGFGNWLDEGDESRLFLLLDDSESGQTSILEGFHKV